MQASRTDRTTPADTVERAVGAVALGALALIHVEDLPDTITSSLLIGIEYLGLIVSAVLVAGVLLTRSGAKVWLAAAALAGSAMLAYTLSRTTGIPGDSGDVGNWRCALGLAALTVEAMIILVAASALFTTTRTSGVRRPTAGHDRTARRVAARTGAAALITSWGATSPVAGDEASAEAGQ
ncbi:MAG: hypothetical protein QOF39_3550 [Frankiales bacterium]|nr:hypothetical protein [Frankiales bacterium]